MNTFSNQAYHGAVLALGNFDGVHRGHAALLAEAQHLAASLSAPLAALTFEPHPRQIFRPADPPFRLTTPAVKARLLAERGVETVHTLPFSRAFSLKSADEFVREILVEQLQVKGVVAGGNFLYGHNRGGTMTQLRAAGERYGFVVKEAATLYDERGEPYSSTRIRQALGDGRPDEAAHLLGRPWEIDAVVERGDQRGRELGYPTANGDLGDLLRPAFGIYAVRVTVAGDSTVYNGVANIGIRPMWKTEKPLLEAHIFDFDRDIYGRHMRVELINFLRPEAIFADINTLKQQIALDCINARQKLEDFTAINPLNRQN